MGIIERVRALGLPTDQFIVIGSGLLDAYGLRAANDVDLAVTPELFAQLEATGDYQKGNKYDGPYLIRDDLEIWLGWGEGHDFASLKPTAVTVEGIMFVDPQFLMERKRARGTEKDLKDIELLEGYLDGQR
jgi:hypothetical protein